MISSLLTHAARHHPNAEIVSKTTEGGRTSSAVTVVTGRQRVEELAAMLGGVSAANLAAAEELLRGASR